MRCINCGTYSFNKYRDWFDTQQKQDTLPTDATPQRVLFCEDEILNPEQRQWLDDWLDRWIAAKWGKREPTNTSPVGHHLNTRFPQ